MKNFLESGKFVVGVNYWQSKNSMKMWRDWDAKTVDDDFKALAKLGCQTLRVFPLWPDFQPIERMRFGDGFPTSEFRFGLDELPDTEAGRAGVDETMMERFETLAGLAQKRGMNLIVALLTGQMTYGFFMPPGLAGLNPANDPVAMTWERRFVQYFVKRMKGHKAIAAWEYGNECNCWQAAGREDANRWLAFIGGAIRQIDASRPIVSGMSATDGLRNSLFDRDAKWTIDVQAEHCDFVTAHSYLQWTDAGKDPCDSVKQLFAPAVDSRLGEDVAGKPSFMEEIGFAWRPMMANQETLGRYLRGVLWNLWAEDCRGLLWWCAFDQQSQWIAPYDWEAAGPEHGIMSSGRKPLASGNEIKKFSDFLAALPFDKLPPVERKAVCVLGDHRQRQREVAHAAFIMAKQAGFELEFQQSSQPLKEAKLYLLPSAPGKSGLTGAAWDKLKQAVAKGSALYMSSDDSYLTELAQVFQAEVSTRSGKAGARKIEFRLESEFSVELPFNSAPRMRAAGAKALGFDANGEPLFFEGRYGKGKVFLLGLPLEKAMSETPLSFEEQASKEAWRVYKRVAKELLEENVVEKGEPSLFLTERRLSAKKLACLAVNNSPEKLSAKLKLKPGWRLTETQACGASAKAKGSVITLEAEGCSGVALILER